MWVKKGLKLNFVYRYKTKDITKNFEFTEGIAIIKQALEKDFFNAEIFTVDENIRLLTSPDGKVKIFSKKTLSKTIADFSHDNVKTRLVSVVGNIYLKELGITNANWELRREMNDKYRQINRYIELLESEIKELSILNDIYIVDMGSGKAYLTFALYDYLVNILHKNAVMIGVESREELVSQSNAIALKAGFNNLSFISSTIKNAELHKIDILIALHACDTATDDAIYRGISSNASLIVLSPCCHKQIRKELNITNEISNIVKFGILKERQAEIITDSLRAMIMEAYGYKTKVFEFITTEHTSKNLMILGRKVISKNIDKEKILKDIHALKKIFGIKKHYLETLLEI